MFNEDKEDSFFLSPVGDIWQGIKAINWWHEIKEAFPFFDPECVNEVKLAMAPDGSLLLMQCKECGDDVFLDNGAMAELSKHGVDRQELLSSCAVVCAECTKDLKNRQELLSAENERPLRDMPEPFNCTPYYIAALVLCALLILDGFLTEFGVVDYSPILK